MKTDELKVLDLFSGCGGLSLGLHLAHNPSSGMSYRTVMAVDNWEAACNTYEANLGIKPICSSVDSSEIEGLLGSAGTIDIVVGGPPCQGFSTSGKRALDDPRNDLVWAYLRAVEAAEPMAFILENVSGFASFSNGLLLAEVKAKARELGYHVRAGMLQASMNGVPQRRRRFFLVGSKRAGFRFPGEVEAGIFSIDSDGLDFEQAVSPSEELTFRDAVSDLPRIDAGTTSDEYFSEPQNEFQRTMRSSESNLDLHTAVGHGEKMLSLMSYIPEGKSAFDAEVFDSIPVQFRPKGGFKNSYARMKWDAPSPTITRNFTTPSSANCIHPDQDRALSIREGARLQSFPDDYRFLGSLDEVRLQIGNAVPPLLGKAIGLALLSHLSSSP